MMSIFLPVITCNNKNIIRRFSVVLLGLVIFLTGQGVMAQGQAEQSSKERNNIQSKIITHFLKAYNTGSRDSIRHFVERYFSESSLKAIGVKSRTDYLMAKYAQHGPLALQRTGKDGNGSSVWMRGTVSNFWLGVETTITEESPYKVDRQSFKIGGAPKENPLIIDGPLKPDSLASVLDNYFNKMEDHGLFSGAVLVAKDGHPIYERAAGWADKRSRISNRIDTRFPLASITKSITSTAILRLKDQQLLSLDDPLTKYVPEYPEYIAKSVTVEDLLTHQSGIEFDDFQGFNRAKSDITSLEELLDLHLTYADSLESEYPDRAYPIGEFDYSNEGYDLLGLVIERIAGKSYPEAIRELVLQPAGMLQTGFIFPNQPIPHLGKPQFSSLSRSAPPTVGEVQTEPLFSYPWPAGGIYSTAGDMGRFVHALTNGNLLDSDTFREAVSRKVLSFRPPPFNNVGYGYGFDIADIGGQTIFGHGGTYGGASTNYVHFKSTGHTVVILSNYAFVGHGVFTYLLDLLTPASEDL